MDKDGLCTYPCSAARSLAKALAWFEPTCVTSKSVHRASDFSALTSSHHRCIGRAGWLDWTELGLWHQGSTSAGWCCWWWQWVKKYSALHCDALVTSAGLSSRPLLALSLIHIAAEARVGKNSGVEDKWKTLTCHQSVARDTQGDPCHLGTGHQPPKEW